MGNEIAHRVAPALMNDRVLTTLNPDGSRRWMRPREARGRLWKNRLIVAWFLIGVFTALPWLRVAGKPPILLDFMTGQFSFFGTTFRPSETGLLALLVVIVLVGIFLVTALWGRVWCGWACPQTVYMEFVFRPLERLFLGRAFDNARARAAPWKKLIMYAVFLVISAHLANTFLAYFVGTDRLIQWTLGSPSDHSMAFAMFAVTVCLMMFDFVFFREQMCTLACPYGRFQSALLDKSSLIIAYDKTRGEPRANASRRRELQFHHEQPGDCVDCGLCVKVCPTGIDIRGGLQMECVNCTQCIDICNGVMGKLGKQPGLIRYAREQHLTGGENRRFRVRWLMYLVVLMIFVAVVVVLLFRRQPATVEQVGLVGANFISADDGIHTPVRLMIENYTNNDRLFSVEGAGDSKLEQKVTLSVPALDAAFVNVVVVSDPEKFIRGKQTAMVLVRDTATFSKLVPVSVAGPFAVEKEGNHPTGSEKREVAP